MPDESSTRRSPASVSSSGPSSATTGPKDTKIEALEPPSTRQRLSLLARGAHEGEEEDHAEAEYNYDFMDAEWLNEMQHIKYFDPSWLQAARKSEVMGFADMEVYDVVDKSEIQKAESHILVGARCVITNKGTFEQPQIKARRVAQEFANKAMKGYLFAGTPNLASLKYIVSRCAMCDSKGGGGMAMLLLDVKSAFLDGDAQRNIFIRFPPEEERGGPEKGACLVKAMYGTRDAPLMARSFARHACSSRAPGIQVSRNVLQSGRGRGVDHPRG